MNDQVLAVIHQLTEVTSKELVRWRRTDDGAVYVLARPQGVVTVGRHGLTDAEGSGPFVFIRFTDDEGNVSFHWRETTANHTLDPSVKHLLAVVETNANETRRTMASWLEDLGGLEEPF